MMKSLKIIEIPGRIKCPKTINISKKITYSVCGVIFWIIVKQICSRGFVFALERTGDVFIPRTKVYQFG